MRNTPDDSQIKLFDFFDEVKPKIELGQSFERVDDAAKQGLIPPYDFQSPEGIPFWLLVTASGFKGEERDDCCDLYAKKGSTDLVDPVQLPVELACLALYKNIEFYRSTKAVDDDAIIVSIGSKLGSLKQAIIDSGQTISQSQSVRRVLTARALIDYLGIGGHPFFGEQDQRSGLEIKVDERILKACVRPITGTNLRSKARGNGDEERSLYPDRIEYLVQQEKLYTWKERRVNYYCVTPPPDESEPASDVVDVEVEVVSDQSTALMPTDKALSKINSARELAIDQHDRLFLERFKDPRNEWFIAQCDKLSEMLHGRPLPWVEFGGRKWLTVKQVATLLGMDPDTIFGHFEQFPLEHSVLSIKLTGGKLSAYKECYPPNPPEPTGSDPVGSGGLGGLDEKAAHGHSSHFVLVSPPGVTWVAYKSNTPESDALFKGGMIMAAAIPDLVENKVKTAIELGRNQQLDRIPALDMQEIVTTGLTQALKACEPLLTQAVDGEFAGISPSMTVCNQIIEEETPLPPMFTSGGRANWRTWVIGDKPVNVSLPVLYVIFIDYELVGRYRECFSVGMGGAGSCRISASHPRIRLLDRKQIPFKVLWTQVQRSTMKEPKELEKIEQKLQERLDTLWERQWSKEQQSLLESEYPLFA